MSESWREVHGLWYDNIKFCGDLDLLQEAIVKQLDIPIVYLLFFVLVTNYIL